MKRRLRAVCALLGVGALVVLSLPIPAAQAATTGSTQTYLVLYKDGASSQGADALVRAAGGTFVYNYQQIGVVIARSDRTDFRDRLLASSRVDSVAATSRFAVKLNDEQALGATQGESDPLAPADDSLESLQWDMVQIHAPEAHAITGGSRSVLVAGKVAANDDNGHGTHTAGTIAAAANGIGIIGVAPNVRIAGIKAGNADGFFFPEAVVCAFMWAGTHGFNVTNNSYFADPWYFNCKNDPEQRAIWKAERRAIRFATSKGVAVVAAEGNFSDDLAHPTQDTQSPDDTTPTTRSVSNDCAVVPVEVAGVVGVTADGNKLMKTYYSSYGMGSVQVVAPGGDRRFQVTADAVNGRVLSTWPSYIGCPAALKVVDGGATYCYLQGTSMASPHVAGLAALIASLGTTSPGAITARIGNTADA